MKSDGSFVGQFQIGTSANAAFAGNLEAFSSGGASQGILGGSSLSSLFLAARTSSGNRIGLALMD